MNNNKIINLETCEVIDDSKYIIVDELIANTIAILNKLGYKTKYSCSGHCTLPKKELFVNCNINFINNVNKDDIVEVKKDSFDYWHEWTYTGIYILFEKKYEFKNLPEGFVLEDNDISRKIDFYENQKRRKIGDIQREIEKYNKILYDWASNLPNIN